MAVPNLVTGQHAKGQSSVGVASLSVSLPGAATPGNMVAVFAAVFQYTPAAAEVADNQGNGTYARDEAATGTFGCGGLFSKQNVLAAGTFTVTETYTGNQVGDLFVAEFSGVAQAAALDKHGNAIPTAVVGPPSTWTGPASGTQTQPGNLALAATNPAGSANPENLSRVTAGWADIDSQQDGTQFNVSIWSWRVVPDTATQQVAYSDATSVGASNNIACVVATYKAAPDAGGVQPVRIPNARVGPMALRQLFRRAVWPGSSAATTPVSNTATLPVEAAQGIVQTGVLADESAQGISTSSADPVEATGGIATTASEPVESLQAIASAIVEPVESLGTVSATAVEPVEALQGIAATGSEPVEANQGISTTASDPIEATGAVAATASDPVEALQGISSTASDPVEAQGNTPVAQTAVLPFESLAGGITTAPVAPVESLAGITTTKQSPIEATGGVAASPTVPVESLAGVTSSTALSVESGSPVSRALVAVFEALAGIANAVLAPFESIRITPLSGPADTTRTRSGPAASRTTFSGGSGRTSTGPGDGETTTNLEE